MPDPEGDAFYEHTKGYLKYKGDFEAMASLRLLNSMDIFKLKEMHGDRVCLFGNIDLDHTLTGGTPEETAAEVKEEPERVGKGGGYIIASSNGLVSYCKPEDILAMKDTILKYGWYK